MNDFRIIPYLPIDGIMPFRDSFLSGVWDVLAADGVADRVFFDGSVTSGSQFVQKVHGHDNLFFFGMMGPNLGGFCWLDSFAHNRAHIHIYVASEHYGPTGKAMGKAALRVIGGMKDQSGRRMVTMLAGITEAGNTLAVRYAQAIGMRFCGNIPGYLYNKRLDQNVDASVLSYVFGG